MGIMDAIFYGLHGVVAQRGNMQAHMLVCYQKWCHLERQDGWKFCFQTVA